MSLIISRIFVFFLFYFNLEKIPKFFKIYNIYIYATHFMSNIVKLLIFLFIGILKSKKISYYNYNLNNYKNK